MTILLLLLLLLFIFILLLLFFFFSEKNKDVIVNCYDYAFGNSKPVSNKSQPGQYSYPYDYITDGNYTCDKLIKYTMRDYPDKIRKVDFNQKCDDGEHKIVLMVDNEGITDYHFMREGSSEGSHFPKQDREGEFKTFWTHKLGNNPVRQTDGSGNLITNPSLANNNYGDGYDYKDICGYFCVKS